MPSYYTGILILTELALVLMCFVINGNATLSSSKKRRFIFSFIITFIGALCEWGALLIAFSGAPRWLHLVVKTFELSVAPFIPIAILTAITEDRILRNAMVVAASLNLVLEVLSAAFGFIFFIDEANVYHHGNYYFIYIVVYLLESIGLLAASVKVIRRYQSKKSFVLVAAMLYMVVGLAL